MKDKIRIMNNNNPFFSIVIANYNYGHLLSSAIESIITQDCDDYELIIVDGGSTDNSVEVIKEYEKYISWWVSEPDKGQSNAFNKGFSHAKGKFFTWLNADDLLLPGTLSAVKSKLMKHPDVLWATGNVLFFLHANGKVLRAPWGPHCLPIWLQGREKVVVSFGPTTFWSQIIYNELGPIDESLHYTMDTDYWVRITYAGYKQLRINHYCWAFRMHEDSKTAEYEGHLMANRIAEKKEHEYIAIKYTWKTKKNWRYIGLFMRFIDCSMFVAFYNLIKIRGKDVRKVFKLCYDVKIGVTSKK